MEKRAKSEQKSTKKRIEKMMKKRGVLEAPGWGDSTDAPWPRDFLGPPNYSPISFAVGVLAVLKGRLGGILSQTIAAKLVEEIVFLRSEPHFS